MFVSYLIGHRALHELKQRFCLWQKSGTIFDCLLQVDYISGLLRKGRGKPTGKHFLSTPSQQSTRQRFVCTTVWYTCRRFLSTSSVTPLSQMMSSEDLVKRTSGRAACLCVSWWTPRCSNLFVSWIEVACAEMNCLNLDTWTHTIIRIMDFTPHKAGYWITKHSPILYISCHHTQQVSKIKL